MRALCYLPKAHKRFLESRQNQGNSWLGGASTESSHRGSFFLHPGKALPRGMAIPKEAFISGCVAHQQQTMTRPRSWKLSEKIQEAARRVRCRQSLVLGIPVSGGPENLGI